jgi:hypothetical protein
MNLELGLQLIVYYTVLGVCSCVNVGHGSVVVAFFDGKCARLFYCG